MKKVAILLLNIIFIFPTIAQERVSETNPSNITRQGFGTHMDFGMGVGFVNAKRETEGSSYYFDTWDTEGTIYIKDKGRVQIKKVNINLYDNKLEAIYDENNVFTFNSESLIKIVINDKVFRTFEINKELKFFELIFNDNLSIYRYYSMSYSSGSSNPMLSRKANKYIKKAKYYLYKDNEITQIKLSKKSFAKLFQSDTHSQDAIVDYIEANKLSLNKEEDLLQVFNFVKQ